MTLKARVTEPRGYGSMPIRSAHARLPIVVGVICVLMILGYWALLFSSYDSLRQGVRQETLRLAEQSTNAMSLELDSFTRNIDYATSQLAHVWQTQSKEAFTDAVMFAIKTFAPGALLQINVYDTRGKVIYNRNSDPDAPPLSFPAPRWVLTPEVLTRDSLYICPPIETGTQSPWMIRFSKPVMKEGRLDAVISVYIAADYLEMLLKKVFSSGNDVAMLLMSDGTYLARSQSNALAIGKKTPETAPFLVQRDLGNGSFEGTAAYDDVARLYNWRRSSAFPLIVSVGMDTDRATRPVEQAIADSFLQNTVATILLLGMGLFVLAMWIQRSRRSSEVLEMREQLSKLVAEIPGAVFQYQMNPDHTSFFPYVSKGIADLYGIDHTSYNGDSSKIFERLDPRDRRGVLETVRQSAQTLQNWEHEFRVVHPDGQIRWVLARANPERLSNGATLWHGYLHDNTHEREVDQALTAQSLQLELALEAVQDGIWEFQHDKLEVRWDERIRSMLGYGVEHTCLGIQDLITLIHPVDLELVRSQMSQAMLTDPHGLMDISLRLQASDGRWLWVQARGRVIEWDEMGQPARSMGLMHDISDRVAESQLRDALLNRSVASITLVNSDRRLIEANARFKSMFLREGVSLETLDIRDLHIDEDHWKLFGQKYSIIRINNEVRFEFQMKDRHGDVRWLDMHGVLREPGNPNSDVIWTWLDVSDRHAADQALSLERLRLRTLLHHFPGGVLIVDSDGTVVFVNDQANKFLNVHESTGSLEGLDQKQLAAVIGEQAQQWLEQAKSDASLAPAQPVEIHASRGVYIEIEYLDIQDHQDRLGSVWLLRDVTQRKREALKLRELASTDSLTGLPNRRCFMEAMALLKQKNIQGQTLGGVVLMLDIDHFKLLNDAYGHAVGDEVLIHAAQILRSCLRDEDLPARLGGEEFAVLLPQIDLDFGQQVAERIRKRVEDSPFEMNHKRLEFTISIGISAIDLSDVDRSIRRADRALYAAKAQGRNKSVIWQPRLDTRQSPNTSTDRSNETATKKSDSS